MAEDFASIASSGSLLLAIPVAVLAGLVSFFSPCVIPLVPGYLSYATGLSGADLAEGKAGDNRGRMLLGSVLFVLGFAVVFVLLGFGFGAMGSLADRIRGAQDVLQIVLGIVVIGLGVVFLGGFGLAQRTVRFHAVPQVGLAAAPVLGFLFGLGWAPCVGPTLAAILTLGYFEGTAVRAALLAGFYALGLGLPFIAAGMAYERSLRAFVSVRRHQALIVRAGGVLLIVIGVLLVTGWWAWLVNWVQIRLVAGAGAGL